MTHRQYTNYANIDVNEINFALGNDRNGKPQIQMFIGSNASELAILSPACVTNWPRVTGDGNFGTMWGPQEVSKAKYTIDLTDGYINNSANEFFAQFEKLMSAIDDRLLDFVQSNQLKVLGRKNLSRDECKMLQIRSVRSKYDKTTGALTGHSIQLSTSKFQWDGCGGRFAKHITVCDHTGAVIQNGNVQPGDVVAATMYANQIYTGVGGDKFGIHWSFEDVQVVCQRSRLAPKTLVSFFNENTYDFAQPYCDTTPTMCEEADMTAQFSEPMTAA